MLLWAIDSFSCERRNDRKDSARARVVLLQKMEHDRSSTSRLSEGRHESSSSLVKEVCARLDGALSTLSDEVLRALLSRAQHFADAAAEIDSGASGSAANSAGIVAKAADLERQIEDVLSSSKKLRLGGSCIHGADKGPSCEKCMAARGRLVGPYAGFDDGSEVADFWVRKLRRMRGGRKISASFLKRLDAVTLKLDEVDAIAKEALADAQSAKKRAERLQAVVVSRDLSRAKGRAKRRRIRRAGIVSSDEEEDDGTDGDDKDIVHVDKIKEMMNVSAGSLRNGYVAVALEERTTKLLARAEERACDEHADDVLAEGRSSAAAGSAGPASGAMAADTADDHNMPVEDLENIWTGDCNADAIDRAADDGAPAVILPFLVRCDRVGVRAAVQVAIVEGDPKGTGGEDRNAELGHVLKNLISIRDLSVAISMMCAQIIGGEPHIEADKHVLVRSEASGAVSRELVPGSFSLQSFADSEFGYLGHQQLDLSENGQIILEASVGSVGNTGVSPSLTLAERYVNGCLYAASLALSHAPKPVSKIDPDAAVVRALKTCEDAVDLSRALFRAESALAVSVCCLMHSAAISRLSLRSADLSVDTEFMMLAEVVRTMPSLHTLDVSLNPISAASFDRSRDGVTALLISLGHQDSLCAPSLRHLDISHVPLLDETTVDCAASRAHAVRALSGARSLKMIVADGVINLQRSSNSTTQARAACTQLLDAFQDLLQQRHQATNSAPASTTIATTSTTTTATTSSSSSSSGGNLNDGAPPMCSFRCNRGASAAPQCHYLTLSL